MLDRHALLLAGALALWGTPARAQPVDEWASDDPGASLETVVEGQRSRPAIEGDERSPDQVSLATATPEDALEGLAGVHLLRDGGPLSPVRVRLRGLEGPRLGSELMGLRLDDPATGGLDAAAVPFWALGGVTTSPSSGHATGGGGAGLHFHTLRNDTIRARVGVGTLSTLRLDAAGSRSNARGARVSAGLAVGSTEGDFRYLPATPSGAAAGPVAVRANNDQQRAAGLVHATTPFTLGSLAALAWASAHEGGVPGFATAPTAGLRGRHLIGGARAALTLSYQPVLVELDATARGSERTSWDELRPARETLASIATSTGALVESDALWPGLTLRTRGRLERAELPEAAFTRDVLDVGAEAELRVLQRWLLLSAELGGGVFSDLGLLPRAGVGAELSPTSRWAVGGRVTHGGRAPTLDELYAPRGLVLGNPSLRFERASEGELYLSARSAVVTGRVAAFVGRMEDSILYVPKNAFEVQAVNTGGVWRSGLEGHVVIAPHPLLGLEATASAVASRLDATGAPLPVTPPLFSRVAGRVGEREGASVHVVLRQRAAVTNNLYGTLITPAYALVDLVSRVPLGSSLAFTAALTNALDVLDARDANLLPLPGRQLFVALEVSS